MTPSATPATLDRCPCSSPPPPGAHHMTPPPTAAFLPRPWRITTIRARKSHPSAPFFSFPSLLCFPPSPAAISGETLFEAPLRPGKPGSGQQRRVDTCRRRVPWISLRISLISLIFPFPPALVVVAPDSCSAGPSRRNRRRRCSSVLVSPSPYPPPPPLSAFPAPCLCWRRCDAAGARPC